MSDDDSREIRREYVGNDVRFEFPIRPLGAFRLIGLLLIGFGVLFLWEPAHEPWHSIRHSLHETSGGPGKLFSLFEIPFVLGGLVPIMFGLLLLFGRCRVEWKEGRLRGRKFSARSAGRDGCRANPLPNSKSPPPRQRISEASLPRSRSSNFPGWRRYSKTAPKNCSRWAIPKTGCST